LLKLPFKSAYMFRPGMIQPTPGLKNTLKLYSYINWMLPAFRMLFPKFITSLRELGVGMINSVSKGYPKRVLEVPDIIELSRR
jgi:hypothetical protein